MTDRDPLERLIGIVGMRIFGGRGGLAHGNDMGQGQKHRE